MSRQPPQPASPFRRSRWAKTFSGHLLGTKPMLGWHVSLAKLPCSSISIQYDRSSERTIANRPSFISFGRIASPLSILMMRAVKDFLKSPNMLLPFGWNDCSAAYLLIEASIRFAEFHFLKATKVPTEATDSTTRTQKTPPVSFATLVAIGPATLLAPAWIPCPSRFAIAAMDSFGLAT